MGRTLSAVLENVSFSRKDGLSPTFDSMNPEVMWGLFPPTAATATPAPMA